MGRVVSMPRCSVVYELLIIPSASWTILVVYLQQVTFPPSVSLAPLISIQCRINK